MNRQPGARKTQILETLACMLEQPHSARITTAALAKEINLSEAALYRHFSCKAAIFKDLINLIETLIFEDSHHINATEPRGRRQLGKQVHALLLFAERHRGLTRVLTGDALATEDWQLQAQLDNLIADIEAMLRQSAQQAAHELPPGSDAGIMASLLMHWVLGRWLRYVQTSWRVPPAEGYARELALLGL